jgi:hypothetical protein
VTDNRKPVAMIGPPPPRSDAAEFRKALLIVPFPIEVDF